MAPLPQTAPVAPAAPAERAGVERGPDARRDRIVLGALLVLVAVVQVGYVVAHGAVAGGDTARYLAGGHDLFHSGELSGRQALYAGYVVVVGLIQLVGLGLSAIAVVQALFMVAGTAAVFSLGRRLGGTWAGVVAGVLFGLNPELVRWTAYALPEALYVAWLPIAVWLVERAARERRGAAWAGLGLVFLAALRPNGWPPALLAAGYLILARLPTWRGRAVAIGAVLVAAAAVASALPAGRGDTDTLLTGRLLRQGQVIWEYRPSYVAVPRDPTVRDDDWPGFVRYAARHPGPSARVLVTRVAVEVRQTRPYYSPAHNLMTLAAIAVLYGAALLGLALGIRVALVRLIGLIVLAHLAVIALTIADYDGRFGRHYFGLLAALGGYGLATVAARAVGRTRARRRSAPAAA